MDLRVIFPLCFCLCSSFVNYTFSRVVILDYNEEVEKVLAEMKISNPTENDKKLAKKIVEERVRNENEKHEHELHLRNELAHEKIRALEDNLTDYIREVAKINVEKTLVEEFAKKLWCPIKIRDEIENFPVTYLPSVQYVRDQVIDVKKEINNKFDKLFSNMLKCVENLKSVANSNKEEESFAKVWSMLKEFVPQEKSLRLPENQMQVGNAIVQLAYAKSAQEAQTFWRDQCLEEKMSGLNEETLKYLLYEKMILNIPKYFKKNKEREFAEDYIEVERISLIFGKNRFLTEKHRDCKMVLYFSDDGKIKTLRSNLTSIFPDMPFYNQIHEHCANQSSLWDILSVLKLHNVIVQAPTPACKPRLEDYVQFVEDLRLQRKIGLANVVEFLIA